MDNGGFYAHVTEPGCVNVGASASGEMKQLAVDVAPNQERWVRIEWGTWGAAELTQVTANEALAEVGETRGITTCER